MSIKKLNKLGELFCGAGGLAEGAKKAGFKHVWATDLDEDACKTFKKHHKDCHVIQGDVYKKFINKEMKKRETKPINGLLFGFPCNDFSLVGKRKGLKGKYGPLYKAACTALNYFKPEYFVAENVTSIALRKKDTNSEVYQNFVKIIQDLAKCNYKIFGDRFKFEDYGVPQTRHRLILVGFRADFYKSKNIKYGKPSKDTEFFRITSKKALEEGVPGTDQTKESFEEADNKEEPRHSDDVKKRLKNTKQGQNVWQISDEFGLPNVKKGRMSQIYKKLKSNEPSYTVTGSGGGGTHVYHYSKNRALTNRESARLQTFDDNYSFEGGKESVRKQIGMAVPVLAAKKIMLELKKTLLGKGKKMHHDIMIEPNGKTYVTLEEAQQNELFDEKLS